MCRYDATYLLIFLSFVETASEGEVLSGEDTNSSFSPAVSSSAQLLKSLADLSNKDGTTTTTTTTTTETSASEPEGVHTETESSQDETICRETKVRIRLDDDENESKKPSEQAPAGHDQTGSTPVVAEQGGDDKSSDAGKTAAPVPVSIIKVNPDVAKVNPDVAKVNPNVAKDSKLDKDSALKSDSEPEIIDLVSDTESPVRSRPAKPAVSDKKTDSNSKSGEVKDQGGSSSSGGKEDVSFIDLTVDSSDNESMMSTPPRRALHETAIKAKPSSDKGGHKESDKKAQDGDDKKETSGDDVEVMEVDDAAKSDTKGKEGDASQKTVSV